LPPAKRSGWRAKKLVADLSGVVALSETLYAELKNDGVNVSVLCPTFFNTGILDAGRGATDSKVESIARPTP